jgi:hypothetical protein
LLEQETAKRASDSPSEGEKRVKSLKGLSNREAQDRQHLRVCRDPVGITVVEKPFKVSEKRSSGGRVLSCTESCEYREAERRPFGGFEFEEDQEGKHLKNAGESQGYRLRKRKQRPRPLIT